VDPFKTPVFTSARFSLFLLGTNVSDPGLLLQSVSCLRRADTFLFSVLYSLIPRATLAT
jgi:hypothetical protein